MTVVAPPPPTSPHHPTQYSHLTDAELAAAHLEQTADPADAVQQALVANGPNARVCVLPEGPQTVPYVTDPP